MSEPILSIRGLEIKGKKTAGNGAISWDDILKGVNLDLYRKQVVGLIGESGAGKSTLGLAALGYIRRGCELTGGEIIFDGQSLHNAALPLLEELRGQKIAYVAQSAAAAFNPAHKLLKQVTEVTQIHGGLDRNKAKTRAIELFGRMALPNPEYFGDRFPHEVSGGQLQRAMTAMALSGQPDIVVFDEPTTALDVTTQIEVLSIIKEVIRELHTSALYITHDLAVVAQIADRIKVLRHGMEIEEQDTAALIESPKQAYTRELLAVQMGKTHEVVASSNIALQGSNISAYYGRQCVLNDVSFTCKKGTSLALVGESGSGKSTLARVIMGLKPADAGQIKFNDNPLPARMNDRDNRLRRAVQMVYQLPDVALNPRHTVGETIGRAAQVFSGMSKLQAEERAKELLRLTDLDADMLERYPGQLSGGQKQRVCIARALAAEPELIICDEVTSALDPLVAEEIIKLLLRLQSELGVSYIFITHDMTMVRAIADDIVVMQNGAVVEQGSKDEIFSPPFADYTELLISSTPQLRTGWLEEVLGSRRMQSAGN